MYIRGKISFLKYRYRNGELFIPIKYSHSYKSRQYMDYCLKLIENPDYKYTTYSEQLLYESLLELSKECGEDCSVADVAFMTLELMFGALGPKMFD